MPFLLALAGDEVFHATAAPPHALQAVCSQHTQRPPFDTARQTKYDGAHKFYWFVTIAHRYRNGLLLK